MRNTPFWWVLISLMVLLDIYFFQALKIVTHSASPRTKTIIFGTYWALSILAVIVILILPNIHFEKQAKFIRTTIFAMIVGLFLAKLIGSIFFFIDDVRRFIQWIIAKISSPKTSAVDLKAAEGISRSVFLSWVGMIAGGGLFGTLI